MPIARSNGYKIAFDVVGDGPPLVLHPGMFQVGAHWTDAGYTSVLAATHTVITVDPLGLGNSDSPRDPIDYALERRTDYVTAVLDEVGADRAAYWGYSLGALTGFAVAVHAPERLTRLVAGAFDPIDGFGSALALMRGQLGLPDDADVYPLIEQGSTADPALAAVIEAADPAALRANYAAFSAEPGLHDRLAESPVPMLLYAGTGDIWYQPMRTFAERTGTRFLSIPDHDHITAWSNATEVLPRVSPFLAGDLS
ncbi:alpha/beta fold hydrolase [Nocardia suismassiliense]|uniref:alpha/beta fold hydrolase n=1 Tax=Nocardia suismassiliense TaxID=2077092 RepID=UPI00131EDEE8|nr:alpha/beta hydrolase [Nocardia suismassiliense]